MFLKENYRPYKITNWFSKLTDYFVDNIHKNTNISDLDPYLTTSDLLNISVLLLF